MAEAELEPGTRAQCSIIRSHGGPDSQADPHMERRDSRSVCAHADHFLPSLRGLHYQGRHAVLTAH